MLKIGQIEYEVNEEKVKDIESNIAKYTCKTNLSPHLLFKSPYTEGTSKIFIGNWLKDGFWITRYRKQFVNFRADIIATGNFVNTLTMNKLVFRFSIGFSGIIGGFFIILLIALILASIVPIYLAFGLPIIVYILMTSLEMKKAKNTIEKFLLSDRKD